MTHICVSHRGSIEGMAICLECAESFADLRARRATQQRDKTICWLWIWLGFVTCLCVFFGGLLVYLFRQYLIVSPFWYRFVHLWGVHFALRVSFVRDLRHWQRICTTFKHREIDL